MTWPQQRHRLVVSSFTAGLRYLEYYEFGLVKKALAEREVLLKNAPHIISPLIFRLPHRPHLRPAWMIRAGLFLYDNLSKRLTLPKSKSVKFSDSSPLNQDMVKGFEYADAWVDDARLTVLNAVAAKNNGAEILTQTQLIKAQSTNGSWQLTLLDKQTQQTRVVSAKVLVNAAGPWVENITDLAADTNKASAHSIRLVKGSHIVVPKIHDDEHAYILQNEDNRIVFVLPYEDDFSLIGTTDVEYKGDPSDVAIAQDEIDYLVTITNEHFTKQISADDVVHTYSGVRPLMHDESEDAQAVTRDYTIELVDNKIKAPLLNIYGGKITTYRTLAEAAVNKIAPLFVNNRQDKPAKPWTKQASLPGGDFSSRQMLSEQLAGEFPWLPLTLRQRFIKSYGTLAYEILKDCQDMEDLGEHFGAGLYQKEICYLVNHEWALNLDDVIWRRTKLGLRLSKEQQEQIKSYLIKKFASELSEDICINQCCA